MYVIQNASIAIQRVFKGLVIKYYNNRDFLIHWHASWESSNQDTKLV